MKTERWQRIEQLFHRVSDLVEGERSAVLEEACGGDTGLRREVEDLLAADRRPDTAIHEAVGSEASSLMANAAAEAWIGKSFGSWRITSFIGEGGMGAVYRASRDDRSFELQAAIKLLRMGWRTRDDLDRFRRERRILATLEHPHIARLLDGGERVEGDHPPVPFIVMEHVEGVPITKFCQDRALTRRQRIALFLQAVDATGHAHQKLVLHRDLKPDNILVTETGAVKLLDFGIAKMMQREADTAEAASTMLIALTPEYASPEQVRGDALTAASDIYSLGVVLYELLSGRRPFSFSKADPAEVSRVVFSHDPPALGVDRDLDTIVAKAMHKDPARRYRSADRLADDLNRYLNGLPVLARRDTLVYRLSKFAMRHRVAVGLAMMTLGAVLAGLISTSYQARRAQRRSAEIRRLTQKLLFDLDERLAPIAGNTEARRMLVETALEYLDRLQGEARGDPDLERDLARGYEKFGDVQGSVAGPNTGRSGPALASYYKALEFRERLPLDEETLFRLARLHQQVSSMEESAGRRDRAYAHARQSLEAADRLLMLSPGAAMAYSAIYRARIRMADLERNQGNFDAALEGYRRSVDLCGEWKAKHPRDADAANAIDLSRYRLGRLLQQTGNLELALEVHRQQEQATSAICEQEPGIECRRDSMIAHHSIARVLGGGITPNLMRVEEAIRETRQSVAIAEALAAEDPGDARAETDVAVSYANLASFLADRQPRESLALAQKAVAITRRLLAKDPGRSFLLALQADALEASAQALCNSERPREAHGRLTAAQRIRENLVRKHPRDTGYQTDRLHSRLIAAQTGLREHQYAAAAAGLSELSMEIKSLLKANPKNLTVRNLYALGRLESGRLEIARGNWRSARAEFGAALEEWNGWIARRQAVAFATHHCEQARQGLAACDRRGGGQVSERPPPR